MRKSVPARTQHPLSQQTYALSRRVFLQQHRLDWNIAIYKYLWKMSSETTCSCPSHVTKTISRTSSSENFTITRRIGFTFSDRRFDGDRNIIGMRTCGVEQFSWVDLHDSSSTTAGSTMLWMIRLLQICHQSCRCCWWHFMRSSIFYQAPFTGVRIFMSKHINIDLYGLQSFASCRLFKHCDRTNHLIIKPSFLIFQLSTNSKIAMHNSI